MMVLNLGRFHALPQTRLALSFRVSKAGVTKVALPRKKERRRGTVCVGIPVRAILPTQMRPQRPLIGFFIASL